MIKILVIDNDRMNCELIQSVLARHGYQVLSATSGIEGLAIFRQQGPRVTILDLHMPDMTGLQVAESMKNKNFHSEIVFTTAHQHYAYDALGIEPLDFLTKPFCIDDLEIVIQKYIAKAEKKKHERKVDKFIHSQTDSPKIKLPTTHGVLIIELKDIVILKSKANNCFLYIQDGTIETITRNLYIVIRMLNSPAFFKINRSNYINLNYLQRVDKKTQTCFLAFNHTIHEEAISRIQIVLFEKLRLFPVI